MIDLSINTAEPISMVNYYGDNSLIMDDIFEKTSKELYDDIENIDDNAVTSLSSAVTRYVNLQSKIKNSEDALKIAKKQLTDLETNILPEIMGQLNCSEYVTNNGEKISVKEVVRASIPSMTGIAAAKGDAKIAMISKRAAALSWLQANGLSGIIKSEININVGKDEENKKYILENLTKLGIKAEVEETVNPMTLSSTFKELLSNNEEIPRDVFNLYDGKIAKISRK